MTEIYINQKSKISKKPSTHML